MPVIAAGEKTFSTGLRRLAASASAAVRGTPPASAEDAALGKDPPDAVVFVAVPIAKETAAAVRCEAATTDDPLERSTNIEAMDEGPAIVGGCGADARADSLSLAAVVAAVVVVLLLHKTPP